MVLKQRLDQRQVQKLILAPALQQAIKLLPLTNLELIDVIQDELSQNPILDLEEDTLEKKAPESAKETDKGKEEPEWSPDDIPGKVEGERTGETAEEKEEIDFESYFQEYIDEGFRPISSEAKEAPALENILSKGISLWDHLNWQAGLTFFDKTEREIAQFIIGNINEDGYLTIPVKEIAESCQVSEECVEKVREKIKMFDPVGVASIDLKEALLAQMDHLQVRDDITRTIVSRCLPLLEKSDYSQLARQLNIPLASVKHHIEIIKSLDPAPGRKYSQEKTFFVVPDIIVSREGTEFKVSLNDEGLPRLRINSYYKRLLAKASKENPEAYRFLKDKMKKALWFLRSLDQRDQTIFKVAKYIVDRQQTFLDKGIDFLKPLTLQEIAQEIGVHESTVGRVVANKYMITPRGVYSLKYFFHKSLVGDYGEEISSLRIKDKIRKLIESEERSQPLSDIEIGDILARENLRIARRTVAKYRKQLKIPPSHIRKRKFVMEGT